MLLFFFCSGSGEREEVAGGPVLIKNRGRGGVCEEAGGMSVGREGG